MPTDNQATTDVVEVKNIMLSANPTSDDCQRRMGLEPPHDQLVSRKLRKSLRLDDVWLTTKVSPVSSGARFYMDKVKAYSMCLVRQVVDDTDEDLYKARDSRDFVVPEDLRRLYVRCRTREDATRKRRRRQVDRAATPMARHALYEGTYRKYQTSWAWKTQPAPTCR